MRSESTIKIWILNGVRCSIYPVCNFTYAICCPTVNILCQWQINTIRANRTIPTTIFHTDLCDLPLIILSFIPTMPRLSLIINHRVAFANRFCPGRPWQIVPDGNLFVHHPVTEQRVGRDTIRTRTETIHGIYGSITDRSHPMTKPDSTVTDDSYFVNLLLLVFTWPWHRLTNSRHRLWNNAARTNPFSVSREFVNSDELSRNEPWYSILEVNRGLVLVFLY